MSNCGPSQAEKRRESSDSSPSYSSVCFAYVKECSYSCLVSSECILGTRQFGIAMSSLL